MSKYRASTAFERTPEQYKDMFLSWERDDQAFFAAGACHILAETFMQLHQGEGFKMVHIKPKGHDKGHHMFVTNGDWAFDFGGWTKEKELLDINIGANKDKYTGWDYELVEVTGSFEDYCRANNHRLPWQFPYLPWERARNYIKQFDEQPPVK